MLKPHRLKPIGDILARRLTTQRLIFRNSAGCDRDAPDKADRPVVEFFTYAQHLRIGFIPSRYPTADAIRTKSDERLKFKFNRSCQGYWDLPCLQTATD